MYTWHKDVFFKGVRKVCFTHKVEKLFMILLTLRTWHYSHVYHAEWAVFLCSYYAAILMAVKINIFKSTVQSFSGRKCFMVTTFTNEPPHGKTNNLHRRKQRRRSASR